MDENIFFICLPGLRLHVFYCVGVFVRDKFEFHLSETGGKQQRHDQDLTVLSDHQGVLAFMLTLQSRDRRCS